MYEELPEPNDIYYIQDSEHWAEFDFSVLQDGDFVYLKPDVEYIIGKGDAYKEIRTGLSGNIYIVTEPTDHGRMAVLARTKDYGLMDYVVRIRADKASIHFHRVAFRGGSTGIYVSRAYELVATDNLFIGQARPIVANCDLSARGNIYNNCGSPIIGGYYPSPDLRQIQDVMHDFVEGMNNAIERASI